MSRVLVAYATRMGSTREVAEAIAERLEQAGLDVDVRPCAQAPDAWKYDAVIIGSAVYLRQWDKTGLDYLRAQAPDLAERPTWLFQTGPCGEGARHEQIPTPFAVQPAGRPDRAFRAHHVRRTPRSGPGHGTPQPLARQRRSAGGRLPGLGPDPPMGE